MDLSSLSKLADLSVSVAVIGILALLLYHLLKHLDKSNNRQTELLNAHAVEREKQSAQHRLERDKLYDEIKKDRDESNDVLRELKTVIDTSNRMRNNNN